jgi:hypothetical protein
MISQPIQVPQLAILGLFAFILGAWGFRHGLDSVLIAGLFVVFARATVDVLAIVTATMINIFYGIFDLFASGNFTPNGLFAVINGDPNAARQLINIKDPTDSWLILIGTILFLMISYVGIRFAAQKAGGKDSFLESVFGFVGGAAMGYLVSAYVIDRHFTFPQQVVIVPSEQTPQFTVNGPLIVAIVLVLIVFGVQRSKPKKKA